MKSYLHLISLFLFIPFWANAQEEINITGNTFSISDGDLSPAFNDKTDFDFAIIGGGSKTHTFTIENLGTSDLTINSITGTGDFTTIGVLSPTSPIPAGGTATFTVTFTPSAVGLQSGTITIDNSDADEAIYDFAVQGTGVNTGMGSWDPLLYPASSCSWTAQDNNTTNSPYASWSQAVTAIEAGSTNNIISLQPDAYVGSYDYDNANGNESCLGHQVATTLDADATQNGLEIIGSLNGCLTVIDLNSGSGTDQWANFSNMNGLTIRNLYLRGWGGAINMTNCSNVLIENCVFEDCDNAVTDMILLTGCNNVTFRGCSFLGNDRATARAVSVTSSGTSGLRILFENCDFGCNATDAAGGALLVGGGSFVEVNSCTFSGNQANTGRGGAINVSVGGDLIVNNSNFIDNFANSSVSTDGGGAIYINGNSSTTQTTVLINACHFFENVTGTSSRGGAIVCRGNSTDISRSLTTIQNSIFERNGADRGGAILAINATVNIDNNFFNANQNAALSGNNTRGGALYFQNQYGNYNITNNTFTDNLSSSGQVGRNDACCFSTFTITNNDYGTQSNQNLTNSGGTAGWSLTPSSLATTAADFDCTSGSYCAFTVSGSCLSNAQSPFICAPEAANSASISGQVWEDVDGDGIQEVGDNGISNAYVLLYDENGYLVGNTTTDASGNYIFPDVLPGNYTVVFANPDIPTYLYMSPANQTGSTESTDSDQASETYVGSDLRGATSFVITLTAGNSVTDVDAGFSTNTLPIELLSFEAKKVERHTVLHWSTASEENNDYFQILGSQDGIQWKAIGEVKGAGNSSFTQHYNFKDLKPFAGDNYYKLVQYDFDGSSSYSDIVVVEHPFYERIQFYPNPAQEILFIQQNNGDTPLTIQIVDQLGRQVLQQVLNDKQNSIDLSSLTDGHYSIRFYSSSIEWTERLIIQK
jgi:hypothetical protein